MKYVFGIDIGGTAIKIGLLNENGELLDKSEIPTDKRDNGAYILSDVADLVDEKLKESHIGKNQVQGIGLGVPGPVDSNGTLHKSVNLGWKTFNVADELSKLTNLKVRAANDANLAALGEMFKGSGKGYKNVVMLTLGTGVGGGIIIDGKLITGVIGAAGEIGHIPINSSEKTPCNCGNYGCLDQYVSATGISRISRKMYKEWKGPTLLDKDDLSSKAIFEGVKSGDELSKKIAEYFGEMLGRGLAIIDNIVNPEIFIIGGGVSHAGEVLIDCVRPSFNRYAFHGGENTEIVLASLGNDAGIYGAYKLI